MRLGMDKRAIACGVRFPISVRVNVGADAGKKLLSLVAGAKNRLVIVSPWLSPASADLIVKKQEEGVDVTVVTSNSPENRTHQEALARLIRSRRQRAHPWQWLALPPGVSLVLGGVYLALCMTSLVAGVVSVVAGAVLCWFGSRTKTRHYSAVGTLAVMPPEPFLHAKLYVADDKVAVSSANFTVSGLQHNLECAAFLNGQDVAEDAIRQVDEMTFGKAIVLRREGE